MLDEISISCPFCGEGFTTLIDRSAGNQTYIEDCQICCNPIQFDIHIDADDLQVNTRRDNE